MYTFDIAIIGSGPGGYVAAIRASQLGLKAVVIEKDKPGGVCLNIGCIPSKSLIHQASIFQSLEALKKMGITFDLSGFSYESVMKKSREAAEKLSKGVQFLLKKNNISYVQGSAHIKNEHTVIVGDSHEITAKNIIIATGSRPRELPNFKFNGGTVLSSDHALMLTKLPKKICILGAGVIGIEFAYIMHSFGVEVTLVEMLPSILPMEDKEAVDIIRRSFKKKNIAMFASAKALQYTKKGKNLEVVIEIGGKQSSIETDQILVAIGRIPNSQQLGLEQLGIKTEKGYIETSDYYQTNSKGIYAIGDVINTPQLAHVASKEGEIAVEHIAGKAHIKRVDESLIPYALYCEPQLARFGYTEEQLNEKKIAFTKAVFPYRGAGKSVAIEKDEGLVKILSDTKTKEILGAHIVGAEATEMIHELLLAKKAELLPDDIATMIHAHPTLSEALMEAARGIEGWTIHA